MSQLFDLYRKVGAENFGAVVCQMAPYFSTISPRFIEVRPRYCELTFAHTKSVENHLGTVHAIAMCNGAELAAGVMTDASLSADRRWIPAGMTVQYLKKAVGDLTVVADGAEIDWEAIGNAVVPCTVRNPDRDVVCTAHITMKLDRQR